MQPLPLWLSNTTQIAQTPLKCTIKQWNNINKEYLLSLTPSLTNHDTFLHPYNEINPSNLSKQIKTQITIMWRIMKLIPQHPCQWLGRFLDGSNSYIVTKCTCSGWNNRNKWMKTCMSKNQYSYTYTFTNICFSL